MTSYEKYIKVFIFVSIHFLLTFVLKIDTIFFEYDAITYYYIIVKVLFWIFLFCFYSLLINVIEGVKKKNPHIIRESQIFIIYFLIEVVLLLFLWPGTWYYDDLYTLQKIGNYTSFDAWQNVITGIYHDILLQTLPFPGGIILQQSVIISICVAYIVTSLEELFKLKAINNFYLDTLLKIVPFLLPPVLMYQFSGYRIGIYVYIELVLIVALMKISEHSTIICSISYMNLAFLVVIASIWRTESFIYVLASVILLYMQENRGGYRRKITFTVLVFIGFLLINGFQNHELEKKSNVNNYKMISLLCPATEIVRSADFIEDGESINDMGRAINIDMIINNPEKDAETLYWDGCVYEGYTKEDYNTFLKVLIKMTCKYPRAVLGERIRTFIYSVGIIGDVVDNSDTATYFDFDCNVGMQQMALEKNWIAYKPININARKCLIFLLAGKTKAGISVKWIRYIFYNAFIPIFSIVIAWFDVVIHRKWSFCIIVSAVVIKMIIIFVTEPTVLFFYWLSIYCIGYVYLIYRVIMLMNSKANNKKEVSNG